MKIALGSDHAGYKLKEYIKEHLQNSGEKKYTCYDFGAFDEKPVDYPDIALALAESVSRKEFDLGILVCGTGAGVTVTANKVSGIRAALCSETFTARMARKHNNCNILALGARATGPGLAQEIVEAFLASSFEGGRHQRRLEKIYLIEKKYLKYRE